MGHPSPELLLPLSLPRIKLAEWTGGSEFRNVARYLLCIMAARQSSGRPEVPRGVFSTASFYCSRWVLLPCPSFGSMELGTV